MGLPWFDYYGGDVEAVAGAAVLKGLTSVAEMGEQKGETPLPENEITAVSQVIGLTAKGASRVREFAGQETASGRGFGAPSRREAHSSQPSRYVRRPAGDTSSPMPVACES